MEAALSWPTRVLSEMHRTFTYVVAVKNVADLGVKHVTPKKWCGWVVNLVSLDYIVAGTKLSKLILFKHYYSNS